MPKLSKRDTLCLLKRDELLALLDALDLDVPDRRRKDDIVDALARTRKAAIEDILAALSRDRLKEMCREVGLDDGGREKALIVARLLGREDEAAPPPTTRTARPTERPAPARQAVRETTKMADAPKTTKKPTRTSNGKLTLPQLERHLYAAADILRGKMDASEFKEYIFGMLFLKRCSDQFDARREEIVEKELAKGRPKVEAEKRAESPAFYTESFFVPPRARWSTIRDEIHHNVGDGLNKALGALEEVNSGLAGVLHHIDFNRQVGQSKIPDKRLRDLIVHFNGHRLRNEDFEFPDLLGAAYEYLIAQFADSAGKKGGEFYTPRAVVRLMVRLAKPQEGFRIYDPCSGSGGMLIQSKEYVEEQGGNSRKRLQRAVLPVLSAFQIQHEVRTPRPGHTGVAQKNNSATARLPVAKRTRNR